MESFRRTLRHPATWIALLALVVASGGTGYAVAQVTGKNIKNSSVTGKDIKNGSLSAKDADSSLRGQTGPQGPPGKVTVTTVTNAQAAALGTHEGVADCPVGSKVVGGGYVINPNLSAVTVARSYPVDEDTWLVRAVDFNNADTFTITIYASCVPS